MATRRCDPRPLTWIFCNLPQIDQDRWQPMACHEIRRGLTRAA
uniref:Uncharacterized protein n=1 Tax=Arundo donax TaxID=35708 RepID=A0A0A9BR87_ARUDO